MAPIQDPRPRAADSVWSAGGSQPEVTSQVTRPLGAGPQTTGPVGTGATPTSAAGWRPSSAGRDAPTTITPLSAPLPSTVPPAKPQPRPVPVPAVMDEPVTDKPATGGLPWESIAPDVSEAPEKPEEKAKADKADATATPAAPKKKRGLWSYTLVHVLVLLAVAFLLGWIIMMLLNRDGSALDAMGAVGPQVTTVTGAVAAG